MDSSKKKKKMSRYFSADENTKKSEDNVNASTNKSVENMSNPDKNKNKKSAKNKGKASENSQNSENNDNSERKNLPQRMKFTEQSVENSTTDSSSKPPTERFKNEKQSAKKKKRKEKGSKNEDVLKGNNVTVMKKGEKKKQLKSMKKKAEKLQKKKEKEFGALQRISGGHASDAFEGSAPIKPERILKYKRGHKVKVDAISTSLHQGKMKKQEQNISKAIRQAARSDMLCTEQAGFLEPDEGEYTSELSQYDISKATDITSATKFFNLSLNQFGPYSMHYSRNGRHLLLGGARGHVAAMDWQTKKLMCEINVMETVRDVKWLHIETMFAVAQKEWVHIYDNQGTELHCLKSLDRVLKMEFLPYHFLLAAGNEHGYLQWLDVSIGEKVAGYHTDKGPLSVMCQNPSNAILHCGHSGGTVTMWSPNVKKPLVHMLCHAGAMRSMAVTQDGNYMATSAIDRKIKIWDLRMLKSLYTTGVGTGAGSLTFSQRGLLGAALGNSVETYRDVTLHPIRQTYLRHQLQDTVKNVQFCPFEDVLGVGHARGFTSVLVPGAGEPNFDAFEANPFQSKKQRREMEVKMLLDKIQPDMISMDTSMLGQLDVETLQDSMERKAKLLYLKPQKIDFEPRHRMKGRSKTGNFLHRKSGVTMERRMQEIKTFVKDKEQRDRKEKTERDLNTKTEQFSVFNRFKKSNV